MHTGPSDELLSAPAVARMLGTSVRSVRHMVRDRQLSTLRLPHVRGFRFRRADVHALIAQATQPAGAEA